jgi:hypothetical protein
MKGLHLAYNGKPLMATIIAITIATPSTQSTGGLSFFLGVPKSWNRPKAREMMTTTDSKI